MKKVIPVLLVMIFTACDFNGFDGIHTPRHEPVVSNVDISYLRELAGDQTLNINEDIIVAGYVTANDRTNNFYRTFIIEDPTGAVEIKAGMFSLHNTFTQGRMVAVKAMGLMVGSYNGVLQIGRKSVESDRYTDYIANRFSPGGYFWPQSIYGDISPIGMNITELDDNYCGRLIRISNLLLVNDENANEGMLWAPDMQTTYRFFKDGEDNEIAVVTSGYADFASDMVPALGVSISGILMKGNTEKGSMYLLKIRDLDDVEIL